MENLTIYNQLKNVPKEAQKEFNNGKFKGTDINPMWRIKKMTEVFGMCGVGWYYKVVKREIVEDCAFVSIELYVKIEGEWSAPIYGEGGNTFKFSNGKTSDEAYKMALTDAVSNATKQLGLGADIWFSQDKTKYTANGVQTPEPVKIPTKDEGIKAIIEKINNSKNVDELNTLKDQVIETGRYTEEMNDGGILNKKFFEKAIVFFTNGLNN